MLSVKVSFWLTDTTSPDSGAMRIVPRSHLSNELPPSYGAAVGPQGKDVDTGAGGMKDSMVIGRGVLATGEPEGAIDLAVKAGSAVIFDRRCALATCPAPPSALCCARSELHQLRSCGLAQAVALAWLQPQRCGAQVALLRLLLPLAPRA